LSSSGSRRLSPDTPVGSDEITPCLQPELTIPGRRIRREKRTLANGTATSAFLPEADIGTGSRHPPVQGIFDWSQRGAPWGDTI